MSTTRESCRPLSLILFLAMAVMLASTVGCASNKERWAEVQMQEISYQNLYSSILDMLELEGYVVHMGLPDSGTVETEWLRGISRREVRGPSRRKVHVELKSAEAARQYMVRMRVEEQIIRKGGLLSSGTPPETAWEAFPDNFEDAEYLAAKLRALLSDYAIKVHVETGEEDYYP